MDSIGKIFISSAVKRLSYYKELGDKTLTLLSEAELHFKPNEASNSIAVIIQHVSGNMLSRWTDFLTSDGEKEWRNRDEEFETHQQTKEELLTAWEKGWLVCLDAIKSLTEEDLLKTIHIRSEGLSVMDAVNRQLAHYPYHVGQIVFIGKMALDEKWSSLSIPRGKSQNYNNEKFAQPKARTHFTDEYIKK